ncbi:hypothetical protein DIT68_11770 [Brumimicrobium oceani]|uniref:Glycosyltransferase RgtA/B/C/D-like domain-containing protein n=2 Tax=Brumimicrobium oceani TaxID=2100725 RepID=A0A2U2XB81_9FLAO|nr:hypothetical protein DIT68_11770 [Brumimicrobium oceani]
MVGFGWLIILMIFFWIVRLINVEKPHFKLFYPAMLFKLGFGLLFALTYTLVLKGGDTTAYWEGAVKLNHLFWDSPEAYFREMIQIPSSETIRNYFNQRTGYPPSWIYREPESFFVSKIVSLFTFVTFNSYLAMSLLSAAIVGFTSWKLYELVKDFTFCKHWILAGATLFIPTVAFWSSGVSKDTFVLAAFQTIVYIVFSLLLKKKQFNLKYFLLLFISIFFLYKMRDFMLIAIAVPLATVMMSRIIKNMKSNPLVLWTFRILFTTAAIGLTLIYLQTLGNQLAENAYLEELAVVQQDFAQNKLYTGPKYDLGITDYSPIGILGAVPISIFTAFYRPFLWEASSAFLLLSALEGIFMMALTYGFFFRSGRIKKHFQFIKSKEFLIFALLFSLILGFFAGFTSGLFNVLIRFKAPFMSLIVIFLASRQPKIIKQSVGGDTQR